VCRERFNWKRLQILTSSSLPEAVLNDDIDAVEEFLREGGNPNHVSIEPGRGTALFEAVQNGSKDIVLKLLQSGAGVNHVAPLARWRDSPLLGAAFWEDAGIVSILIEHGADVNAKDQRQQYALHHTSQGDGGRNPEVIRLLKQHGARIEAQDQFGMTPFLAACSSHKFENARSLAVLGADTSAVDNEGAGARELVNKEEVEALGDRNEADAFLADIESFKAEIIVTADMVRGLQLS
jgi:ankyrin repeat protein